LILIVAVLALVACEDSALKPAQEITRVETATDAPDAPRGADPQKSENDRQAYLADLWERGDGLDYEYVYDVQFAPKDGCDVRAVPPSWQLAYPDYEFALEVPAFAVDTHSCERVRIALQVPKLLSIPFNQGWTSMPMIFEIETEPPLDGPLQFASDTPAVFTFAFHPSLMATCDPYCVFGLSLSDDDPPEYVVHNPEWVEPERQAFKRLDEIGEPPAEPFPNCATDIRFRATMIGGPDKPDRWELVNGCCDRDPTPCDW
jgi:hypothetical protein